MRKLSSTLPKQQFIKNLQSEDYIGNGSYEEKEILLQMFEKKDFQNDPEIVIELLKRK
jgi:hypothetical protein